MQCFRCASSGPLKVLRELLKLQTYQPAETRFWIARWCVCRCVDHWSLRISARLSRPLSDGFT